MMTFIDTFIIHSGEFALSLLHLSFFDILSDTEKLCGIN
jgi:hypothetical protein